MSPRLRLADVKLPNPERHHPAPAARPTHGWTQATADLDRAPYVAPVWLRELRAKEQRRQTRIAGWRTAQVPVERGPRAKLMPDGQARHRPAPTPEAIALHNHAAFEQQRMDAMYIERIRAKKNRLAGIVPAQATR